MLLSTATLFCSQHHCLISEHSHGPQKTPPTYPEQLLVAVPSPDLWKQPIHFLSLRTYLTSKFPVWGTMDLFTWHNASSSSELQQVSIFWTVYEFICPLYGHHGPPLNDFCTVFYLLIAVSNASEKSCELAFVWILFAVVLGLALRGGAGSCGDLIFSILRNCCTLVLSCGTLSPVMCGGPVFSLVCYLGWVVCMFVSRGLM